MAKPNFQYEKRQKELEKKRKKDEKSQRKLDKNAPPSANPDQPAGEAGQTQDDPEAVK